MTFNGCPTSWKNINNFSFLCYFIISKYCFIIILNNKKYLQIVIYQPYSKTKLELGVQLWRNFASWLQVYPWFYSNLIGKNSNLSTWSLALSAKKKDKNLYKLFSYYLSSTFFEFSSSLLLEYSRMTFFKTFINIWFLWRKRKTKKKLHLIGLSARNVNYFWLLYNSFFKPPSQ